MDKVHLCRNGNRKSKKLDSVVVFLMFCTSLKSLLLTFHYGKFQTTKTQKEPYNDPLAFSWHIPAYRHFASLVSCIPQLFFFLEQYSRCRGREQWSYRYFWDLKVNLRNICKTTALCPCTWNIECHSNDGTLGMSQKHRWSNKEERRLGC